MNTTYKQLQFSIPRSIIFMCVLTGLLFSTGEGIRLFPFPILPTGECTHSNWCDGNINRYQKTINRFESDTVQPEIKLRDNLNYRDVTAAFSIAPHFSQVIIAVLPDNSDYVSCCLLFATQLCFQAFGSRAPPLL